MKRIFYYSGYQLTVFHWKNEKCMAAFVFNPDEEGLQDFKTYLMETANVPARILVDLIEEDFNKDTIPHVGTSDRRDIVARLIQKQYRKSKDYVHYKIIDRQTGERKDDVLLYSVLSNPEVLEPWLKVINISQTSICGIWSLPELSEGLLSSLNMNAPNNLLVTQQNSSRIRHTFLKNNKCQSSRLTNASTESESRGQRILIEVEQTIQFLSKQRYMSFDEPVEIHIMCCETDIKNIQMYCVESALRTYHYHQLKDIAEQQVCDFQSIEKALPQIAAYSNWLYSYVCASKFMPIGHYGDRLLFIRFYEQVLSRTLYILSSVVLLVSIIMTFGYLTDEHSLDNESSLLKKQAEVVNNQYKINYQKLSHKLSQAQSMQSSVLLVEKIREYKLMSPLSFMSEISHILTSAGMQDLELSAISWQQQQGVELPVIGDARSKAQIDYSKSEVINQLATIEGRVSVSNSDLIEAVNKIKSITTNFKNNRLVKQLKFNTMPIDFRSKSRIESEAGSDEVSSEEQNNNSEIFEIEMVIQGGRS